MGDDGYETLLPGYNKATEELMAHIQALDKLEEKMALDKSHSGIPCKISQESRSLTIRQDNKPASSAKKVNMGTFVRGIDCSTFALHEINVSVISRSIIVEAKHTGMQDKDDNSHSDLFKIFDVLEEYDIEKAMITLHSDGILEIKVPEITANE